MGENLSPAQLVEVLRGEQRDRWRGGDRVPAEAYLEPHPALLADPECALKVVYQEVLLREESGENPQLAEYLERFPQFAAQLKPLFAVHRALESDSLFDGDTKEQAAHGTTPGAGGAGAAHLPAVPGYEVLEEVGRGGMGVVYRAWQQGPNRPAALKMILAGDYAGPEVLARFRTEAEAVGRLQHPHIVQIYEVGEQAGRPYLSMEYVGGGSLAQKLSGTPLPARPAAQLVESLARAIHSAHQKGIVHRDLKPANILLQRISTTDDTDNTDWNKPGSSSSVSSVLSVVDFSPKITDFGLAKILEGRGGGQTQSGAVVGTPSYMAPEQAGGRARDVGPAADVYALGAILYELLTGRPPFRAETPLETLLQVQTVEPVSPSRLQPKLHRDLTTICQKCLHKEPRKRYASALDLAEDLRRWLGGEPIRARPVSVWERGVYWAKRRPGVAALLALVVLTTAGGLAGITWKWREAAAALVKAKTALYFNHIALAERELATNNGGRAEELLDACPPELRGWEWHYLKRLGRGRPLSLRDQPGMTFACDDRLYVQLAFSPDGRRLAAVSGAEVKVWDASTCQEVHTLRGHERSVTRLAFSPVGQCLASASEDQTVRVWDMTTGEIIHTLRGHRGVVSWVAFSPDGRFLASAGADKTVRVWDATTGQAIHILRGHTDGVRPVAFSPDGKHLASGGWDNTVKVWDATTGQLVHNFPGQARIFTIAFSPDGRRLAAGSQDTKVTVWDLTTGQAVFTVSGLLHWVTSESFSPDGRRLTLGDYLGNVRVWDTATGQEVLSLQGHTGPVLVTAFSRDGQRLVSGGFDATVRVWDPATGQEALALRGHTKRVFCLTFSPDGRRLASAGGDKTVRVWDATPLTGQEQDPQAVTLRGHAHWVAFVAFSPDGRRLASASFDHTVKIWDPTTGKEVRTLHGHTGPIWRVAYSPDGRFLAAASQLDRTVTIWDPTTGQEIRRLPPHVGNVNSLAFGPDGLLASASTDGPVRVWDVPNDREARPFPGYPPAASILGLAFSPDGRRFASAAQTVANHLKVWDTATRKEIHNLQGHTDGVWSVAFSPDGRLLASGGLDHTVKVWDVASGKEIHNLQGHTHYVFSVAFSPDGERLASGSWDQTVRIWDVKTGKPLGEPLRGHAGMVYCVAFSPDGRRLAAASGYAGKGEVNIWDAALWDNQPPRAGATAAK
jgi:WD40 repeat protein